jgi:branched-chain amino acid transport system substrate-binding protein
MTTSITDRGPAIRIGAIFMFSGAVAQLGQDSFDGADVALRLVNDEGGVKGRPLEWVTADGFSPEEAARQAERMIIEQGVRAIVGCYGSNHSIEVSKVCEKHKAVLWVQTAWTATLFDHRPRFTFRTNTYATRVEEAAVDYATSQAAKRIGKEASHLRAAVINEGSAYGVSCGEETIKALRARGIEPILAETYDAKYDGSTVDFAGLVRKVRAAEPDILFASSFIRDAVGILQAMRRAAYRPPVIMTSSAGFGLHTLNLAGDMTEGILSANAPALVNAAGLSPEGRRLQREYIARLKGLTGREPSGFNAMGFCAAYSLFHDVLPAARSPDDAAAIRDAAMSLDLRLGTYPNGWGLKFDSQGQNTRCPPSIDQWQDGSLRSVWPPEIATARVRDIPLPLIA